MTNQRAREYRFEALTDLWTGDADGNPGRTINTGLLGSIRWWFEVLVRGLGASACDPSHPGKRCPDSRKKPTDPRHHCVVCELFGCTGWARKFRFEVLDENGQVKRDQIRKGQIFKFRFTELRPICPEEWALLDLTLRLIADYGAIGGKTVLKPSEEGGLADLDLTDFELANTNVRVKQARKGLPLTEGDIVARVGSHDVTSLDDLRQVVSGKEHGESVSVEIIRKGQATTVDAWYGKRHHIDYGLMRIQNGLSHPAHYDQGELKRYIQQQRWRKVDDGSFAWASLENFWCVKGRYLARQNQRTSNFNKVMRRKEAKGQSQQLARDDSVNRWVAGKQQESKKVFSFKEPASDRRTFGFVKPDTVGFDEMHKRLSQAWSGFQDSKFLEGPRIIQTLLDAAKEGNP